MEITSLVKQRESLNERITWDFQLNLFNAVFFSSFVSDVVNIYYASNEVVQKDEEIQAFVKDVFNFGMQGFECCGTY